MALSKQDIVQLYVALFQRAPEGNGLDNWYQLAQQKGYDYGQMAEAMLQAAQNILKVAPGYAKYYPFYIDVDTTDPVKVKEIIQSVYDAIFNKKYTEKNLRMIQKVSMMGTGCAT